MTEKRETTLTAEVESRLEDLFGEPDDSVTPAQFSNGIKVSPLEELRAIMLSIEWEITDEIMSKFITQTEELQEIYGDDKILVIFLRLLGSIGRYLKRNMGNAHPDAIRLLNSVYKSLEKAVLTAGITDAERKKLLLLQVDNFNKLKKEIALRKAAKAGAERTKTGRKIGSAVEEKEREAAVQREGRPSGRIKEFVPSEEAGKAPVLPDMSRMTTQEAIGYALEEIRKLIKDQFQEFRTELKSWKE